MYLSPPKNQKATKKTNPHIQIQYLDKSKFIILPIAGLMKRKKMTVPITVHTASAELCWNLCVTTWYRQWHMLRSLEGNLWRQQGGQDPSKQHKFLHYWHTLIGNHWLTHFTTRKVAPFAVKMLNCFQALANIIHCRDQWFIKPVSKSRAWGASSNWFQNQENGVYLHVFD